MSSYITAAEIARRAKTSRSRIFYYDRHGLIKPSIVAGRVKLYLPDMVNIVKKVLKLKSHNKYQVAKILLDQGKL